MWYKFQIIFEFVQVRSEGYQSSLNDRNLACDCLELGCSVPRLGAFVGAVGSLENISVP